MSNAADWTGFEQHVNSKGGRKGPLKERRFVRCIRRFGNTEGAVWAALAIDCANGFTRVNAWPAQFEAEMEARHNPGFACKGPSMVKIMQKRVQANPGLELRFLSGQGFHSSGISWIKKYVRQHVAAGSQHTMSANGFLQFLQSPGNCLSSAKSQFRCFEWLARGVVQANVSIIRMQGSAPATVDHGQVPAVPDGDGDLELYTDANEEDSGAHILSMADEDNVDDTAEVEAVAETAAVDEEVASRFASEKESDATELPPVPSPGGDNGRDTCEMNPSRRRRMNTLDAEYIASRKRLKDSLFGEQDAEEGENRSLLHTKAVRAHRVQKSVEALRAAVGTSQSKGCEEVDRNLEKRRTSSRVLEEIGTKGDVLAYWVADGTKKELKLAAGDAEHAVDVCAVVDQGDNIHVYVCESKASCSRKNVETALGQISVARDILESDHWNRESRSMKEFIDAVENGIAETEGRGDTFHKPGPHVCHFVAAFYGIPERFLSQSFRKRDCEVWCYSDDFDEKKA